MLLEYKEIKKLDPRLGHNWETFGWHL